MIAVSVNKSSPFSISSWLNPYHDLEKRIQVIATKTFLSSQDKQDLKKAMRVADGWMWPAGRMRTLLRAMPKEKILELILEGDGRTITKELDKFLRFFDRAALLDLSDLKTSEKAAGWFHSRGLIKQSVLKSRLEKEGRTLYKELLIDTKHFIYHLLDVLVALLGINELNGKQRANGVVFVMDEYAAVHKLETYGKIIGYPAVLFGLIYTYIELTALSFALTTVAVASVIVFLVAYEKYLKPCPKDCAGLKNLTIEMLRAKEPTYMRQDILRKIERAFKEKKGVLLVGEPGSGKSSIPRALAEQIAEGKKWSFIPNAQIFACGASKFKNHFDGASFNAIEERFKKYSEEVILFFDEFHGFFVAEGMQGTKTDEIKMFCETFKYIIGATTKKEYKKIVKKQHAIKNRRFVVIKLSQIKDKKIKIILSQHLQVLHPHLELDTKTLDHIVKRATDFNSKTAKIDAAQSLLYRAIKEMEIIEFKDIESKIDHLESDKKLVEQELYHTSLGGEEKRTEKLERKIRKLNRLKGKLKQKNDQVERIKKMETYFLLLREQSFKMADPAAKLIPYSRLEFEWLKLQAKMKVVGKFIERRREKLSLPKRLDRKLIDKLITERNG